VQAADLNTNEPETFTILGAWDSEPEKGVISYLSPVAQALLNRKVGDEVEFEVHGAKHRHRIEKIELWKLGNANASSVRPSQPQTPAQI
jgi:transcription elongation GreA/GreB family factor